MAKNGRKAAGSVPRQRISAAIPRRGDTGSRRRAAKPVSDHRFSAQAPSAHRRGHARDYDPRYKKWIDSLGWRISGPEYDAIGIVIGKKPRLIASKGSQSDYEFKVSPKEADAVLRAFELDRRKGRHSVPEELCAGVRFVSSIEFLAWAQSRRYPVPEWLPDECERRRVQFDLRGALSAVMNGYDPVAARGLIAYFYDRLCSRAPIDEQVLYEYLEHAFGRIAIQGDSADRAFGLARGPGEREREITVVRDLCAVAHVVLLQRNGRKWLDAIGDVANIYFSDGRGDGTIKAAIQKYRRDIAHLSDDMLRSLCKVKSRDLTG